MKILVKFHDNIGKILLRFQENYSIEILRKSHEFTTTKKAGVVS